MFEIRKMLLVEGPYFKHIRDAVSATSIRAPSLLTFDPKVNVTLTAAMFYSGHPFQIDFTCEVEEPCEDSKSSKYCKKQKKKGKCKKSSIWKKCKKTCDKC